MAGSSNLNPNAAPMAQTDTQQGIATYAQPYVGNLLGATQAQVLDFDPTTGQATGVKQYQPYSYNAQDYVAGFSPLQQQSQQGIANLQVPGQYQQASDVARAATLGAMGAGTDYQRTATDPYAMQSYMNPYIQASLQPQLAEIQRQYDITEQQQRGQATRAGAYGGSREAVMRAENARNKVMEMNRAIGQGYKQAYDQAQQALQYGSGLGLQGMQAGLQGASQLGNLGTQQLQAQQGILGLQGQTGAQQQALQQRAIDQAIKNYETAQQYPMQQLAQMKGMLSGLPISTTSQQQYQAAPSLMSQLGGLGLAGYGLSKTIGGEGGITGTLNTGASGITDLLARLGFKFAEGGEVEEGDGLDKIGLYNAMKELS